MYGKIFESMYDGSLHEDYKSLIVFQQMIVLADEDGIIDLTPKSMSARTGIPLEYFEYAIPKLESPDDESRTPVESGRRIIRLDEHRTWGWQIVNYMWYRNIATREDKKKADRERIKKKRTAIKANKNTVVAQSRKVSQGVRDVAYTDTDTNTDIETDLYLFYIKIILPKQKSKYRALINIKYYLKNYSYEDLIKAIENYKIICVEYDPEYRKDPANFFGKKDKFFIDYLKENFETPKDEFKPKITKAGDTSIFK